MARYARDVLHPIPLARGNVSNACLHGGTSESRPGAYHPVDHLGRIGVDAPGTGLAVVFAEEGDEVWPLGSTADGTWHMAVAMEPDEAERRVARAGGRMVSLLEVGADLRDDDSLIATQAVALAHWHQSTRFCTRCGDPLRSVESGWALQCQGCGALDYPRTDPAVIVRVTDALDRVLLAHNTAWERNRMSFPAGFVEAGESPERAARREVAEEVGIAIGQLEFIGAQPWPSPRSLMLAYSGLAEGTESALVIRPDGIEIDGAWFFSRHRYADALRTGELRAPRPTSIAHAMLVDWFGGPLPAGR